MDYRRPAPSAPSAPVENGFNFIDLTRSDSIEEQAASEEQNSLPGPQLPVLDLRSPPQPPPGRLPRYSREVIDLEDETPQSGHPQSHETAQVGADEVQFMYSRPLPHPRAAPGRHLGFAAPFQFQHVPRPEYAPQFNLIPGLRQRNPRMTLGVFYDPGLCWRSNRH